MSKKKRSQVERVSAAEYKRIIAEKEGRSAPRVRAYKSMTYKGVRYASRLEAGVAMWLDSLKSAGLIAEWQGQHRLTLAVNGQRITTHIVDFLVTLNDGRQKFVEAKGFESEVWPIKMKLTQALYPDTPYLVHRDNRPLREKELLS